MKVLLKQFNLDAIYLSEMIKQLALRVYCAMKTLSMLMVCKNGCGIFNSICTLCMAYQFAANIFFKLSFMKLIKNTSVKHDPRYMLFLLFLKIEEVRS